MANEFIIRKGYKSLSSSEITGSLDVSVSVHATDVFVNGHGSVSASLSSILANDLDGSGTANYISKFSDADTLTDSIIYDSGTNIGIGTTSPGQKLDVRDGTITSRDSGNVNYAELDRFAGLTLKGNGSGVKYITTPNTDDLGFRTNNAEKMRITTAGNVGIGTVSPLHPLHVVGIISGSDSYINNWGSVSASLLTITNTHTSFSASVSTRFEGLTTNYTELDNIPNDIVSSSIQVDHDATTNFVTGEHFLQSAITTVGTVTAGNINAILPANTVSSSAQLPQIQYLVLLK